MFKKGTMKQEGIDITIRNNPDHVLAPDDWSKVMAVRFGKMSEKEYGDWYKGMLKKRWETRKDEIMALAKEGMFKDIRLKCYCPQSAAYCHAHTAARFLNGIIDKFLQQASGTHAAGEGEGDDEKVAD
jgi:hypothetical protein